MVSTLILPLFVFAQDSNYHAPASNPQAFGKGSNILDVGVGLGGYYSYWGYGYFETPNFVASYENGTFGNVGPGTVSLGALFSYKGIQNNWVSNNGYSYSDRWNYWIFGLRSAYHWNFTSSPRFDPYVGLMLGYYVVNHMFVSNDPFYAEPGSPGYISYSTTYPNYLALSLYIGARYYVSNRVAIWGELGYGYATLAAGLSFKL